MTRGGWRHKIVHLERGARQRPLVLGGEREHSLGSAAPAVLDAVRLIQDEATPPHLHTRSIQGGEGAEWTCLCRS